ncbi:PREDICTED: peptide-N4-(N-acetyl-beta-glucosaminyl)asparagine amidase A [Brassica oleracea var. oleracea]|uniref:Peptide N-acetyl-beta-D-glucosaminyl asparaginase amidase A N-terminal domain-containing protein n=1 Tax=Brassica oleracea var. oleracea TaxID=109376 RepID=A0A0D3AZV0_BRAOL|nr:PREDICTED: peptide-N4-(N-acetyl-beta-glucosaminyl)asparagine amidase A [Brassica oleracea var. oleracea]
MSFVSALSDNNQNTQETTMSKMNQNGVVKFFTALAFLTATTVSLPSSPDRFLKSALTSLRSPALPQEYQELTLPSPSDHLTPSCSHLLLRHSFADTINKPPFTAPYTPPPSDCASPPWSRVILDLRAASSGDQYDRISGLWLGGVELLRTSTAEPSPTGIFWKVRKDVTRYSSLFTRSDLNVTMMLENIVNDVYTGIYHINVTLDFYEFNPMEIISRQSPADLIVPVSNKGVWFMIENAEESYSNRIQLPLNTRKIVLELYVSSHGNDEFWYSNPPDLYIETNKLAITRGNGAYREVVVKIDGRNVGSEVPFPVIFTGGINPLFWEPVVGIGAFNLPSYDIDLTPFLGMLLDGKDHEFALSVNNGISYWLVDANLHLWLDHGASSVEAGSGFYESPKRHMVRRELLEELDGSFKVEAEVRSEFDGWVKSSEGNLTTMVKSVFKVGSLVKFEKDGAYKRVEQRVESKRVVEVTTESGKRVDRVVQQRLYPRTVITSTLRGLSNDKDMYVLVTNVSQALNERYSVGEALTEVYNRQDSDGWMQVEDHNVLAGEARTRQSLRYIDEFGCYSRTIVAANGEIDQDSSTDTCPSSSSS